MRDGQRVELGMAGKPRRAAGRAARGRVRRVGQAIAAEAHGISRSQCPPQRGERLADIGGIEAGLGGKGRQQALVAGEIFQHAGQEPGSLGGGANLGRADAGRWRGSAPSRSPSPAMKVSA